MYRRRMIHGLRRLCVGIYMRWVARARGEHRSLVRIFVASFARAPTFSTRILSVGMLIICRRARRYACCAIR